MHRHGHYRQLSALTKYYKTKSQDNKNQFFQKYLHNKQTHALNDKSITRPIIKETKKKFLTITLLLVY